MTNAEAIADTGFVVAVAVETEKWHQPCLKLFRQYERIYIPQSALAEIAFMLTRTGGRQATLYFLRQLSQSPYIPIPLIAEDFQRTADILDQYADSRVDFVDASIAAVAERLNITCILTIDQRDFQILRPAHIDHFEILP